MSIKRYGVEGGVGTGGQHLPFTICTCNGSGRLLIRIGSNTND